MNILIVDDERTLANTLSDLLKHYNYSITTAYDGEEGLDHILSGIFDLIILDVMMPKIDGFSLLREIRARGISTPVLMLTAKTEMGDKIYGLNMGADDYLTKPFNTQELLARIKALLRRKENFTSDILSFGDLALDRDTLTLTKGEKSVSLGKKEFQILELLMLASGKNIDKERFIEKIWGYDSDAEYNAIEVYVSFLRKKLALINSSVQIKSIRGVGYNLTEEKND